MVDPRRLFAEMPPAEPLTSLAALVRDWDRRYIKGPFAIHRDPVIEYTKAAGSWPEACDRACRSRGADGKMWNHQSRVPLATLLAFRDRLVKHEEEILNRVDQADDVPGGDAFHSVHQYVVTHLAPPGIGPVTVYDVVTRLAAWLEVEPRSVYLHAGPTVGWLAICDGRIATANGNGNVNRVRDIKSRTTRRKTIERDDLPASLKRLADRSMDQVEDFLCAYRHIMISGEVVEWR